LGFLKHLLIFFRLCPAPGVALLAILTAFASAAVRARHPTLIAFAVLLEAAGLLAVATLGVKTTIAMDLGLKGMRVPVFNCIHSYLALLITFFIRATLAIAVRAAT